MTRLRIRDQLRRARPYIDLPLLGMVVGLIVALGATVVITPRYRATASVVVVPEPNALTGQVGVTELTLALSLTLTVADLAESSAVAGATAEAVGVAPDEVHLTGVASLGVQFVAIEATSDDPDMAAEIADAGAAAVAEEANHLELVDTSATVKVADQATPPGSPESPKRGLTLALGAFAGLLVGVAVRGLRGVVGDRFRRVSEVQLALELPVLAAVDRSLPEADVERAIAGLTAAISVFLRESKGVRVVIGDSREAAAAATVGNLLGRALEREGHVVCEVCATPTADRPVETIMNEIDRHTTGSDIVVIVAPPVLAGPPFSLLAHGADVALLVVDSGHTRRADAGRAALLLRLLDVRLAGVVVTGSAASIDRSAAAGEP